MRDALAINVPGDVGSGFTIVGSACDVCGSVQHDGDGWGPVNSWVLGRYCNSRSQNILRSISCVCEYGWCISEISHTLTLDT